MFRRLRKLIGGGRKASDPVACDTIDVGSHVAVVFGETICALGKVVRAEGVRIHGQWSQVRVVTPHGSLMAARASQVRKLTAEEESQLRGLERDAFEHYGDIYKVRR